MAWRGVFSEVRFSSDNGNCMVDGVWPAFNGTTFKSDLMLTVCCFSDSIELPSVKLLLA